MSKLAVGQSNQPILSSANQAFSQPSSNIRLLSICPADHPQSFLFGPQSPFARFSTFWKSFWPAANGIKMRQPSRSASIEVISAAKNRRKSVISNWHAICFIDFWNEWRFDLFSRRSSLPSSSFVPIASLPDSTPARKSQHQTASRFISPHGMLAFFYALIFVRVELISIERDSWSNPPMEPATVSSEVSPQLERRPTRHTKKRLTHRLSNMRSKQKP